VNLYKCTKCDNVCSEDELIHVFSNKLKYTTEGLQDYQKRFHIKECPKCNQLMDIDEVPLNENDI
jgi:hypothetical protein